MKYLEKEEDFKEIINKDLVLVDFFATLCGPCQAMGLVLEEFCKENPDIEVIKVDVDKFNNISKEYGIMSIPTLKVFKKGQITKEHTGYLNKEGLIDLLK